jgi:hypothetical protein
MTKICRDAERRREHSWAELDGFRRVESKEKALDGGIGGEMSGDPGQEEDVVLRKAKLARQI